MSMQRLDHFLVYASDLEATKNFYCDALGLTDGARPPFEFPGYWLYIDDQAVVHLAGDDGTDKFEEYLGKRPEFTDQHTGAVDHIAFRCGEFDAVKNRFETMGIPYQHKIVPAFDLQQLFITDPDGVTIELNFFTE